MFIVPKMRKFLLSSGICVLLSSCGADKDIDVYRLAQGETANDAVATEKSEPAVLVNEEMLSQDLPMPEVTSAEITWAKPNEWEEKPAGGMRYGSFLADGDVDISVIFLEGMAGGDLANVNRWRQQIALEPWANEELESRLETIENQLGEAKIVDFYSEEGRQQRVVAAFMPYKHGTWFFKMTGENTLVENQKNTFLQFVSSVQG